MDCKCGCGQKTNLAVHNDSKQGHVKGEPYKYLVGHHPKKQKSEKPLGTIKEGANCLWIKTSTGWDLEHRVIAEKVLGRKLKSTEEVHHVDEDRFNNKNNNFVICENHDYHMLLHERLKELKTKQWLATLKIG